jgi:drug/metabolite transporter (DMT)-like permease
VNKPDSNSVALDDRKSQIANRKSVAAAELWLLVATLVWGASFALAKNAGDQLNQAGGYASSHYFGQMLTMGLRFVCASLLWMLIFRGARAGWSIGSCKRGLALGVMLFAGIALQHSALARIDEGPTALLTSMAILFVPVGMFVLFREKPTLAFLLALLLAAPGVWLISATHTTGFGLGELLGLGCAVAFAVHIIFVNLLVARDSPWRMTLAQFVMVGVGCLLLATISAPASFDWSVFANRDFQIGMTLMILGPTLISFGLMMKFQPRVSPARAALIYLLEPVFASAFAWWWNDRVPTAGMITGGALILLANAIVELSPKKREP